MRILHCIFSKDFAGSETYCCRLASMQAAHAAKQQLGAAGNVRVLAKNSRQASYRRRFEHEAAPATLVYVPSWWPSVCDVAAMGSFVHAFAPDLLHTHLGRATRRAGRVAKLLGRRCI